MIKFNVPDMMCGHCTREPERTGEGRGLPVLIWERASARFTAKDLPRSWDTLVFKPASLMNTGRAAAKSS